MSFILCTAVHGQVNAAFQQGLFYFLDKKALAPNLGQGYVQYFVAFGLDCDQLDLLAGKLFVQCRLNPVSLPQCQFAGPGSDFN